MKIIAYHVQPYEVDAFKKWSENNNVEVELVEELLTKENIDRAKGFDGITTQQIIPIKDEEIYEKMEEYGIRLISTRTAGVDMFDGEMARKHNIAVTNVPRYSVSAIAEMAVSHAMYLTRNMGKIQKAQNSFDFRWNEKFLSREIRNCTVGIVGTGYIGLTTAKLFKGLGANVIGFDKYRNREAEGILEYRDTLEDLLKEADIVSLHLPLLPENYHMINKENIALMKDDAIIINTGRGALVNIRDIVEALESGKLGGAGMDVLECESLYVNQKVDKEKLENSLMLKLMNMDNVIVTGHFAFFTETAVEDLVNISCDSIRQSVESGEIVNCTNKVVNG